MAWTAMRRMLPAALSVSVASPVVFMTARCEAAEPRQPPPVPTVSTRGSTKGLTAKKFRLKQDNMPPMEKFLTATVCGGIGWLAKFIMDGLNNTTYINREKLLSALMDRPADQGIVTVSNHVSAVDDPGTIAALVPGSWLTQPKLVRWTMCATDRCFHNPIAAAILRKGKVLPVERGKGIDQPYMDDIVHKLDQGEWVHMFPEGTRSRSGKMGRVRLGVAKLIAEAKTTPVVVPFFHVGMENILRVGQWIPLNFGQSISVIVGDPIRFTDILEEHKAGVTTRREMHIKIANRIRDSLRALEAELEDVLTKYPELRPSSDTSHAVADKPKTDKAESAKTPEKSN